MIQDQIDRSPMSRYQIAIVALCVVMFTIEGYDILVIAFALPGLIAGWGLSPAAGGLLVSVGFVGMALGSAFITPLADRIGRRPSLSCAWHS